MLKRLRTLPVQLLVLIVLPLTLALLGVAFAGAAIHTDAMREMVAVRDERAVRAAAKGLAQLTANTSPQELRVIADQWLTGDLEPSDKAVVLILDEQGQVVAHPDPALTGLDFSDYPGVAAVLCDETGSTFGLDPETGEEAVFAYSPVGDSNWKLLIKEPWSAIANPLLRYSQIAPLALVPALLLAAGALYFGLHQIVQPLRRLDAQATRLGWGDFDALEKRVGGTEEIQALQTTLTRMAEQIRAAQAGMRSYAAALTMGQEDERARLARELHDETVQTLIALEHRVHMLRRAIDQDPETVARRVNELTEMASGAVTEVRRVIRALRPLYLDDLGWLPAVQALVDDLEKSGKLTATFQINGQGRRLEPITELALYRIAQEALNNVVRHSDAEHAGVQVKITQDSVTLTISDDGRGFTPPSRPEELASAGHFGLMGIQERTQLVGARLQIESAPGQGTKIVVTLQEKADSPVEFPLSCRP